MSLSQHHPSGVTRPSRGKSLALALAASALTTMTAFPVVADDYDLPPGTSVSVSTGGPRADGHAPIGVMGDHMHKKGEWMLSYRFMRMNMDGNRIGTDEVTPEQIATTAVNQNPVTLPNNRVITPQFMRVVPTKMTMDMHMFGAMYAPSDNLTLMFMLPVIRKSMDHITFAGPAGTTVRGGFTTVSEGVGDAKISGLFRLYDDNVHHIHANLGLSAPTGSIEERDTIFDPLGRTPEVRLPYAMQLGTGTWDLLPGITYTGRAGDFSWGAQYRAEIRLEDTNDEGYSWGDKHAVTGWLAYQWAPWISTSVRMDAMTQEAIDGRDTQIGGPVQTAHTANYGGERVELFGGINLVGQSGVLRGHRLAFEMGAPIYQDLNGPQMETDWIFTMGWQKAF